MTQDQEHPAVKALEWREYPNAFPPCWAADSPCGEFVVMEVGTVGGNQVAYEAIYANNCIATKKTPWEAKAAAQADYEARIRSALSSPLASTAGGWKLVPVEPTEEMHDAARDWSIKKYGTPVGKDGSAGCWSSMLAASPAVSSASQAEPTIGTLQGRARNAPTPEEEAAYHRAINESVASRAELTGVPNPERDF